MEVFELAPPRVFSPLASILLILESYLVSVCPGNVDGADESRSGPDLSVLNKENISLMGGSDAILASLLKQSVLTRVVGAWSFSRETQRVKSRPGDAPTSRLSGPEVLQNLLLWAS